MKKSDSLGANVIVDPTTISSPSQVLEPFGIIENYTINSSGNLYDLTPDSENDSDNINRINTYIYRIPAYYCLFLLEGNLKPDRFAYFEKSVLKLLKTNSNKSNSGIQTYTTIEKDPTKAHLEYYYFNLSQYQRVAIKNEIEIPRELFSNINDYVYLFISRKSNQPLTLRYTTLPENQPFFWNLPVASSIYNDQSLSESKIIPGTVKMITKILDEENLYYHRRIYAEKTLKVEYSWQKTGRKLEYAKLEDDSICKKLLKVVKCTTQDGEYTISLSLPIYVYNRNRNGITAFVWHSGNEDDLVKKSSVDNKYTNNEDEFYNEYTYLLDSLSLETIYGSFASLTKISEEAAARYIVRSLAHQPEGYRSVSVEGHLQYLMGGVLSYIESIISDADASNSGILKDEYFKRVEHLFQANSNSHSRYDANVSYTDLEDIDKNYLKDILGIRNNSNGCKRIKTLLSRVFSLVSKMGITVDYVYCDIENIYSSARDLLVHRFKTEYQDKWKEKYKYKGEITSAHPFYNEIILREIHWDVEFLPSLQALGYAFGDAGKELDDVASVLAGDDKEQLYYGITAGKTYERRRNLNVWDVVMKNYTSKLFYDYIFKPITNASKIASSKLPKEIKCTGHATFCSKGYLNRAERYETYLGGSLELPDGMYSNLSLYGDYMTKGARILNMDNWNILPVPSLFSFFMDNINRLRVIALSSKGEFNVFIASWNIWAHELNKELHFLEYNVIDEEDPDKAETKNKIKELTKAYHKELLFHTFMLNPDKAIAYFNLERKGRKDDPESYIAIDENKYFKYKKIRRLAAKL